MANDVRLVDLQCVHQRDDVRAGEVLAVARGVVGDVRRWIAALTIGDASIGAAEPAHLRLPGAVIAGKFVNKDYRRPGARLFVVQVHAIAGFDFGHNDAAWVGFDHAMLEQSSAR
jgi:hypothetical protein